jgi:putative addiction module component (TIGR02574 family)
VDDQRAHPEDARYPAPAEDIPLPPAQAQELDRRLDDLERDPDAGEPWEVVRARLYRRLKRSE